jgi:endonuclease/exonuclease/phosphatase (EEP) superfamily protein YafD
MTGKLVSILRCNDNMIPGFLKKGALFLIGCVWLLGGGCVSIPDDHPAVANWDGPGAIAGSARCGIDPWPDPVDPSGGRLSALDARGFDLVNWNIYKGRRQGWQADFRALGEKPDLYLVQEAYLTDDLRNLLADTDLNWNLVPAFEYRGIETGVLTASRITPYDYCILRIREPLLHISKSALITRYPFAGSAKTLLVANIHSINFTLGSHHFRQYWQQLESALSDYDDPIILAGDFNTWSAERSAVVRETVQRLKLKPVKFSTENRTTIFGHTVDHIYYRGLIPVEATVYEVVTSDHNPMVVRFELSANE